MSVLRDAGMLTVRDWQEIAESGHSHLPGLPLDQCPTYDLGPMTKSWHLHRHAGAWDGLGKFQVERIVSEGGELAIGIASPSGNATIRFESFYGFRVYDELALSNYWQLLGGVPKCGVYASDSTEHLEWVAANSVHQIIPKGCTNYLIVSTDDVVDVVGSDSPTVQIEP